MYTMGLHMGHDASVALARDGEILFSVEEERFTRNKNQKGFPINGFHWVLAEEGIQASDVAAFCFAGKDILEELSIQQLKSRFTDSRIVTGAYKVLHRLFDDGSLRDKQALFFKSLETLGVAKDRVFFFDHHYLHATSAYYQSPFSDPLIVTSDGKGDDKSSTINVVEDGSVKCICDTDEVSSIGQLYTAVTLWLGFKPNRHEGKITGLAAYGNHNILGPKLLDLFSWCGESGKYKSNLAAELDLKAPAEVVNSYSGSHLNTSRILKKSYLPDIRYDLMFILYLNAFSDLFKDQTKEDIAAGVQWCLEQIVTRQVAWWMSKTGKSTLCLAGGVFANVKLNQRLLELSEVDNIFVQPAMGDGGLSVGGALLLSVQQGCRSKTIKSVYKGPLVSKSDAALQEIGDSFKKVEFQTVVDAARRAAELIADGKLVAVCSGRMEFGPRALGSRSVMISPSDKNINNTANKRFNRTEFMPFAPVVTEESAVDYFKGYSPEHIAARFMTLTYDVVPERMKEIEATVHVDGTARPQVVGEHDNPLYYNILKEHEKITGIPVTVNTSFNAHEEPIVCRVEEAINALRKGVIDTLVIDTLLIGDV